MADASWALQKAVHAALVGDADVLAALGGARVYDHVPRGAAYPYVTIGQTSVRDWSTGSGDGGEHTLTLHVWSKAAGRGETQAVIGAIRRVS